MEEVSLIIPREFDREWELAFEWECPLANDEECDDVRKPRHRMGLT